MPAMRMPRLQPMPKRSRFHSAGAWEEAVERWIRLYVQGMEEIALHHLIEGRVYESHWSRAFLYDDFYGNALEAKWTTSLSGAGAAITVLNTEHAVRLDSGTAASGFARLHTGNNQIQSDDFRLLARVKLNKVSSNICRVGVTNGTQYVRWDYEGGQWTCINYNGASTTQTTPTITEDTNYHFLGIIARPNRIEFFYDGASQANHTTNIPNVASRLELEAANGTGGPYSDNHCDADFAKLWERRLDSGGIEIDERALIFV